jgi:hypothetical protein
MIEVGAVDAGLPLVAVDAGSAMGLAGSLAALGAVAEAAGWAVSLAVDAADGAVSLQLRRAVEAEAEAEPLISVPEPQAALQPAAALPADPRPASCAARAGRRHRLPVERVLEEVWTCLGEDPSTGPELVQLVGAGRSQIEAALSALAEGGRVVSTGEGWDARVWRVA